MSGSIKVGGNTIATHTGAQGAGEITLGTNIRLPASGGIQDSSGNNILTESGGNVSVGNVRLPASGGIKDSSGNNVLTESGGTVTLNSGTIDSGLVFPSGHILQIQRGSRDQNGISIQSNSYFDTVTKSITTVAANSNILVIYDGQVWINGPTDMYTYVVLNRTGGTTGDGDIVPPSAVRQIAAQSLPANNVHTMGQTYTHIDSPAVAAGTTLTYKIKQNGDSRFSQVIGANSSLVLFEIAA